MSTFAKVKLEIEVNCNQPWSDDATMEQVKKQAVREVQEKLSKILQEHKYIRLLGNPRVTAIFNIEDPADQEMPLTQ